MGSISVFGRSRTIVVAFGLGPVCSTSCLLYAFVTPIYAVIISHVRSTVERLPSIADGRLTEGCQARRYFEAFAGFVHHECVIGAQRKPARVLLTPAPVSTRRPRQT